MVFVYVMMLFNDAYAKGLLYIVFIVNNYFFNVVLLFLRFYFVLHSIASSCLHTRIEFYLSEFVDFMSTIFFMDDFDSCDSWNRWHVIEL